jgi:putative hydrolase of the HAD superfamily
MSDLHDALLVDWGGVLTSPILESFGAFIAEHGLDPEILPRLFKDAYGGEADPDHPVLGIETGKLTEEEFGRILAERLSEGRDRPFEAAGIKEKLFATIKPDHAMIEAVKAVHAAGFRTALVSNTWGPSGFHDELARHFDALVMSGVVGMRKPDPEIYRHAAELVAVPPERCVFVDDISANVKGAEAVGMTAIHHKTAGETIPQLEALFGVRLVEGPAA